jgi:hypothetical protein
VYERGTFWDIELFNQSVTTYGNTLEREITNSPYLVYRINFKHAGFYRVYRSAIFVRNGHIFVGTNTSNYARLGSNEIEVEVDGRWIGGRGRGIISLGDLQQVGEIVTIITDTISSLALSRLGIQSYYPLATDTSFSTLIHIPTPGIHHVNMYMQNASMLIGKLVLFKNDSNAGLNLNDPSTEISNYDQFNVNFTITKPGIHEMSLMWKNSKGPENLTVTNPLKYVSVENGKILEFSPTGNFINVTNFRCFCQ